MINKIIMDILKPLNIPISFLKYTGESSNYIVFSTTDNRDINFSDDKANSEKFNVGFNYYYSTIEQLSLINDIKKTLKDNGFTIISSRDVGEIEGVYNYALYTRYIQKIK